MTQIAKEKMFRNGGITLGNLRAIGFKNPYSFIYQMRQEGFTIQTIELKRGCLYCLREDTINQSAGSVLNGRAFWWVVILGILTLAALSIY